MLVLSARVNFDNVVVFYSMTLFVAVPHPTSHTLKEDSSDD